jgi:ABC-2 type transport system ATP-binding protein
MAASAKAQALIAAHGVDRDYSGTPVLRGFDLDMQPGDVVALIGHNGSGKTTALSILGGRLEPTRGSVRIDGIDTRSRELSAQLRSKVAFVPDAPTLYPDLTVADHLDLVALAHGVTDVGARREAMLSYLELSDRQRALPRELSRGMRQKAQLACSFIRPFSVLLMDEPLAGLDPPSRQALHAVLLQAKDDGAAIVFSTHHLSFTEGLADRAMALRDGAVVADGTLDEVMGDPDVRRLRFE